MKMRSIGIVYLALAAVCTGCARSGFQNQFLAFVGAMQAQGYIVDSAWVEDVKSGVVLEYDHGRLLQWKSTGPRARTTGYLRAALAKPAGPLLLVFSQPICLVHGPASPLELFTIHNEQGDLIVPEAVFARLADQDVRVDGSSLILPIALREARSSRQVLYVTPNRRALGTRTGGRVRGRVILKE